ncbi:MAG: glycosyltransferase family 8 protein [Pikeienuella sp.]|uniref:glycosyltransferase family 8 protein n=1 Tax=Pikeienuella sp. TaxID=2831957 RepID=UPI003919E0E6
MNDIHQNLSFRKSTDSAIIAANEASIVDIELLGDLAGGAIIFDQSVLFHDGMIDVATKSILFIDEYSMRVTGALRRAALSGRLDGMTLALDERADPSGFARLAREGWLPPFVRATGSSGPLREREGEPASPSLRAARFALGAGYRTVHLVEPVSRSLPALRRSGGVIRERPDLRLRDVDEVEALAAAAASAGARLSYRGGDPVLKARLPRPPEIPSASPPALQGGPRREFGALRVNALTGASERCAFVTFCSGEGYLDGVRALANSLSKVSEIPLIVMSPIGESHPPASLLGDRVKVVPVAPIPSPYKVKDHQTRFANTLTKLAVFGLGFLDKAVFVDADMVVLKPIDDLFDHDAFAAAPDIGIEANLETFNSGLFVCRPSQDLFERMLARIGIDASEDGGDQGFLNSFFKDEVRWLPREYNTLKRVATHFPGLYDINRVRVLHFVGEKPWESHDAARWDELDRLWFDCLKDDQKGALFVKLKKSLRADSQGRETSAEAERAAAYGLSLSARACLSGHEDGGLEAVADSVEALIAERRDLALAAELAAYLVYRRPGDAAAQRRLLFALRRGGRRVDALLARLRYGRDVGTFAAAPHSRELGQAFRAAAGHDPGRKAFRVAFSLRLGDLRWGHVIGKGNFDSRAAGWSIKVIDRRLRFTISAGRGKAHAFASAPAQVGGAMLVEAWFDGDMRKIAISVNDETDEAPFAPNMRIRAAAPLVVGKHPGQMNTLNKIPGFVGVISNLSISSA